MLPLREFSVFFRWLSYCTLEAHTFCIQMQNCTSGLNTKKTEVITNNLPQEHLPLAMMESTALPGRMGRLHRGRTKSGSGSLSSLRPWRLFTSMAVIAGHQRKPYRSPWMGATRVVPNINQDKHIANERLYGAIPSVSLRIAVRKMELADH